jgi:hypothetical protein
MLARGETSRRLAISMEHQELTLWPLRLAKPRPQARVVEIVSQNEHARPIDKPSGSF